MSELTERAKKYLAAIVRISPTPLGVVEQLFEEKGLIPEPCWLDFHAKYAGYVEGGNPDQAVWGLCNEEDSPWRSARTLSVQRRRPSRPGPEPLAVMCADVDPQYGYNLLRNGEFVGHPFRSKSFEIKVERTAIEKGFYGPGTELVRELDGQSVFKQIEELQTEMRVHLVPEASDDYAKYYLSPTRLLIVPEQGVSLAERIE